MAKRMPGLITIVLVLCLAWPALLASAAGIGIAPSIIEMPDVLRGTQYWRAITILNPSEEAAAYAISAEGEAAPWISFFTDESATEPVEQVQVPANGRTTIQARLQVPEDVANGTYQATLTAQTLRPEQVQSGDSDEATGGASVILQAKVQVTLHVTGTQVLSGEVLGIVVHDTEQGYPFRASVQFRNTGNVEARPAIAIGIYQGDGLVRDFVFDQATVPIEGTQIIQVEGDIQGMAEGEYLAKVDISLGGQSIGGNEQAFSLLPRGTLTREGQLVSLVTEGDLLTGRVLLIVGTFSNTGKIETPAQLVVEAHRDGALIATLESRELLVLPKESIDLKAYLDLLDPGRYLLKCQVDYGGKLTEVRELAFNVALPPAEGQAAAEGAAAAVEVPLAGLGGLTLDRQSLPYVAAVAALVLMILVLSISLLTQRRRAAQPVRSHNRSK